MARAYLYILHFDVPLHHAAHYVGVTADLEKRLEKHRSGRGAKILKAVQSLGGTWRLATVYEIAEIKDMYRVEKKVKDSHGGRPYCTICGPTKTLMCDTPTREIDKSYLEFNTTSLPETF